LKSEDADIHAKDDQLSSILHLAAECDLADAVEQLLAVPDVDMDAKDRLGMRPLHRAASRDAAAAAKILLDKSASTSVQTFNGATPLHICAASAAARVWRLLVAAGADPVGISDRWGRNAVDTVVQHGWSVDSANLQLLKRGGLPSASSSSSAQRATAPTAILSHPICRKHYTCAPSETEDPSAPPENIKRLAVIIDEVSGALRAADLLQVAGEAGLQWVPEARAATMSDVLRVHEWPYVRRIQGFCEMIPPRAEGPGGISSLDGDTTLSHNSFRAAMHAAGAVCQAVDMVVKGEAKNAFAPVRPPGHHAGPKGLVRGKRGGPDSHGFCLLNNVSIGAAYALNVHRDTIKRVAIVDFGTMSVCVCVCVYSSHHVFIYAPPPTTHSYIFNRFLMK
jgi:hypothetical protein